MPFDAAGTTTARAPRPARRSGRPAIWTVAVCLAVTSLSACTISEDDVARATDASDRTTTPARTDQSPEDASDAAAGDAQSAALGQEVAATSTSTGELYVVRGGDATAERSKDAWKVAVQVTEPVLAFDDRPHRGARHLNIEELVKSWPELFGTDPPNAALNATDSKGESVDVAVELTEPSWDEAGGIVTFTARPVGIDRARELPSRMTDTALFIDDAQSTIQLNLINLSQILLQVESASPDISDWTSSNGVSIGWDFGMGSTNGATLNLSYSNPTPGSPFTAQIMFVGDYGNQWQLQLSWDSEGNPSASITQFEGQAVGLMNRPALESGEVVPLVNMAPDLGQTATYQAVFTSAQPGM